MEGENVPAIIENKEQEVIDKTVVLFDAARRALAEATTLDEVIEHRDKAETFKDWTKRRGASLDVQNDAAEFKIDCERKAGGIIMTGEVLAGRGRPKQNSDLKTVEDLGITRSDSSRWQLIYKVDEETYKTWVRETRAAGKEITTAGLIKLAKQIQTQKERERLAAETAQAKEEMEEDDAVIYDLDKAERLFGSCRTIYADPPWKYDDETVKGAAALEYPTMPLGDICAMGETIKKLVHKDGAFLWLWITWPKIREGAAQHVLDAWGFEWKGEVVWNKMRMGLGRWLRGQTEICILGVRGRPKKLADNVPGYLEATRLKHSKKPDSMYKTIESFGAGEYLELFHRGKRRDGWNVFGNADQKLTTSQEEPSDPS